jgi:hypothetical protein
MTGARLALRLLLVPLALLGHEPGRRLLVALVLAAACAGLISLAFGSAEPTGPALAVPAPTMRRANTRPPTHSTRQAPSTQQTPEADSPEQAARAWYAARRHLPVDWVRVLQREQLDSRRVRVLVLAETANGRLDTAQVTVRRTSTGWQARP